MKNFDEWNAKKKKIDELDNRPIFHERDIWYCNLGANVGFEQNGNFENFIRPIIIFRVFNKNIFWGLPITKTNKNLPFYFSVSDPQVKGSIILSQVKLMDSKRLLNKISILDKKQFEKLKEKFKALVP